MFIEPEKSKICDENVERQRRTTPPSHIHFLSRRHFRRQAGQAEVRSQIPWIKNGRWIRRTTCHVTHESMSAHKQR